MKRRLLTILLTFCMVLTMIPAGVFAADTDPLTYEYNDTDKTATVTECKSNASGEITIPSEVTYNSVTYTVTGIGDGAFSGCTELTGITFASGSQITSIGERAFVNCSRLTSITIPKSVTSIGENAFSGCAGKDSVTGSITGLTSITFVFGSQLTSIGDGAFSGCKNLKSIEIPNSVKSIGESAFYACESLESIKIPNGVESIENSTFYGCESLESIEIPTSVKSIGESAFNGCISLTSVEIPNSVDSIDDLVFAGCTSLASITIPASVNSIAGNAFNGCSSLNIDVEDNDNFYFDNTEKVLFDKNKTTLVAYLQSRANDSYIIPDSVTIIGDKAFYNCVNITSIEIPTSVTSIGNNAFNSCENLASITFAYGSQLTSIGNYAFYNCESLTGITLSDSITSIGEGAFQRCSSLTGITFPKSITSIEDNTFVSCSALTSITIPAGVANIGKCAFQRCSSLTSVEIPNSVKSIGINAFQYCSGLTSITLPDSLGSIAGGTFADCSKLISISLPVGVKTIESGAFINCQSLKSISLPTGVTSIGGDAFYNCSNLTSIAIPTSVTNIEKGDAGTFSNCNASLTALIYGGTNEKLNALKTKLSGLLITKFIETQSEFGVNNITANSVTLNEIPNADANDNSGKEFTAQYSKDGENWQTGAEFTGLNPDTEYTFEVGFFETNAGTTATTPIAVYELTPVKTLADDFKVEAETITNNSITLKELASLGSGITAKYRIKKDGNWVAWQTSNEFNNLNSGTTYTFEAGYFKGNDSITNTVKADIKTLTPYTPPANPTIDITGKEGGTVIYDRIKHTITITPNNDYLVKEISLNGTPVSVTDGTMVLENIYGWSRISVTFEPKPEPAFEPDKYISKLKFKANSSKTSKGNIRIKVTSVTDDNGNKIDLTELKDKGYTVKFKYYRSTKKASKYTAKVEKDADINSYINTSGKKGTKYYYKVRVMIYDADGSLIAKSDLKQCRYAARTWSK